AFSSAVRRPDLTSPLFPYTTLFRSLIEQKEAGLLQEQFGQGYPHLPSPTELLAGPVPVASRKTQAVKHCPHSRIDCVASLQPELLRHRGVPLELFVMFGAGVFHFGQFMLEPA